MLKVNGLLSATDIERCLAAEGINVSAQQVRVVCGRYAKETSRHGPMFVRVGEKWGRFSPINV